MGNAIGRNKMLANFFYNWSYFPQLGMMRQDAMRGDSPVIREAIRRLPPDIAAQRQFRITRAMQLSQRRTVLPRNEWMTIEKDVLYLQPYIEQVLQEMEGVEKYEQYVSGFSTKAKAAPKGPPPPQKGVIFQKEEK